MSTKHPTINKNFAKQIADMLAVQLLGNIITITLKDSSIEYLEYLKLNRSPKTYTGAKTFFNHLFKSFSPIRKVDTVKQKDILNFLYSLRTNAPLAVENYFRVGRAFFNWLIKQNYIRQNPFIGIELPKRQFVKPAYYSVSVAERIWNRFEENGKIIFKNILIVAFFTGMRFGELTNLRWRNINFKEKLITVGDSSFVTKTKTTRPVPMNDMVYNLLIDIKSSIGNIKDIDNQFVFSKKNRQKYTVDCISKNFKEIVKELGLDESIHLYSTRHSAASHLVSKGANLYAVKEILGHRSILTTQIYAHLGLDDLRRAIE